MAKGMQLGPLKTFPLVSMLLLSACGGSGGGSSANNSEPQVQTGAFIDSAVEGLRYSTPTRSGMTNANGEFQYLVGETVTFSVGAIELGSAPGQAQVTPFSLFASSRPPTNRNQISSRLNDGAVTDLDRAINVATFLVSLDSDGNPDNGINLGNWNAVLTSANLSFDADHSRFTQETFSDFREFFAVEPGGEDLVLEHLYDSLDVGQDIFLETGRITTRIEEGEVVYTRDIGFLFDGINPVNQVTRTDTNGGGTFNSLESRVLTYDNNGRLSNVQAKRGADLGSPESTNVQTYTYDESGNRLTEIVEIDSDANGETDLTVTITHTYDSRGNRLSTVSQSDRPEIDVPDYIIVIQTSYINYRYYTYNADNQLLTEVRQRMAIGSDTLEETYSRANTYDNNGNLIASRLSSLSFSDLFSTPVGLSNIAASFTYDEQGNRVSANFDHISSEDTLVARQSVIFSYDANSNLVSANSQWDGGINGVDGLADSTSTATLSYNENGYLLESILEQNQDANGPSEFISKHTYGYNSAGMLLTDLHEIDSDGNGLFERSEEQVSTWDNFTISSYENIDIARSLECPIGTLPIILDGCAPLHLTLYATPSLSTDPPPTQTDTTSSGSSTDSDLSDLPFLNFPSSSSEVTIIRR